MKLVTLRLTWTRSTWFLLFLAGKGLLGDVVTLPTPIVGTRSLKSRAL